MIEFKQGDAYGNNFNNGDEALLSDSNRPRDEFGLRINPGMQMDKWDWRGTTKNRYLDQCGPRGARVVSGSAFYFNSRQGWKIYLNNDVNGKLDFGSFTAITPPTTPGGSTGSKVINDSDLEKQLSPYTIGDLAWTTKNGNLVIPEDGSYLVQYYVEFMYSTSYTLNNTYCNFAGLTFTRGTDTGLYAIDMNRQNSYADNCGGFTIQDLRKGEELTLVAQTNHDSESVLAIGTLIAMKLS